MNIYDSYVEYLYAKESSQPGYTEKHRILPGHEGGTYSPDNIVRVSFEEHCLLHFYRYLSYGNPLDLYAFNRMKGDTKEARISRSRAGGLAAKEVMVGCFKDPECRKRTLEEPGRSAYYDRSIQSANGKKRAKMLKEEGFFSPELQSSRGKKGVEVNRANGTGGFDPKNLAKAREKQRELGVGVHSISFQRSMNFRRWGAVIDGERVKSDPEMRTSLSETFVDYHLAYGSSNKYNNMAIRSQGSQE